MKIEHKDQIEEYINALTLCVQLNGVITEEDFKEITKLHFKIKTQLKEYEPRNENEDKDGYWGRPHNPYSEYSNIKKRYNEKKGRR